MANGDRLRHTASQTISVELRRRRFRSRCVMDISHFLSHFLGGPVELERRKLSGYFQWAAVAHGPPDDRIFKQQPPNCAPVNNMSIAVKWRVLGIRLVSLCISVRVSASLWFALFVDK